MNILEYMRLVTEQAMEAGGPSGSFPFYLF